MSKLLRCFQPAPHIPRLPEEKISITYKKLRWRVFLGIIVGYVSFYLVRNNFALAIPHLELQGFTKTELGLISSALPLAYGFSKFVMGIMSDRSNPRYFIAAGLLISAGINFIYGTNWVLSSFMLMLVFMFFNGWFQGMGWPGCARVMVHWFSSRERGTKMSVWNTAQNIGGGIVGPLSILGIAVFSSWHSIFYFPAIIAAGVAIMVVLLVRDTPQSEGLPPIEEHRNEPVKHVEYSADEHEKELTAREILFKYVLNNKYLWYLSFANVFVYLVRYGVISWTPSYLTQVKGFTFNASSWAFFSYEYAAIPGIILCGWISDRFFNSRRTPICIIYMIAVTIAVAFYWLAPADYPIYNNIALIMVGFFIYGPVSLIGVNSVDLVPKKAAGTAAGLTGLLGYVGGAMTANAGIGFIVDHFGWNGGFIVLLSACVLSIVFLLLSKKPKVAN